ncbi:uncharacterized protein LOC116618978 [Nematostella vectensis]|uniref:uncharacterized protein LOC116618978 n=1 Tax=Nematostella vectensis TaxID=45351 RepID=UPI002076EA9F|nr:uncharacterized protein LOC116618978 [Nematostella vectensis]
MDELYEDELKKIEKLSYENLEENIRKYPSSAEEQRITYDFIQRIFQCAREVLQDEDKCAELLQAYERLPSPHENSSNERNTSGSSSETAEKSEVIRIGQIGVLHEIGSAATLDTDVVMAEVVKLVKVATSRSGIRKKSVRKEPMPKSRDSSSESYSSGEETERRKKSRLKAKSRRLKKSNDATKDGQGQIGALPQASNTKRVSFYDGVHSSSSDIVKDDEWADESGSTPGNVATRQTSLLQVDDADGATRAGGTSQQKSVVLSDAPGTSGERERKSIFQIPFWKSESKPTADDNVDNDEWEGLTDSVFQRECNRITQMIWGDDSKTAEKSAHHVSGDSKEVEGDVKAEEEGFRFEFPKISSAIKRQISSVVKAGLPIHLPGGQTPETSSPVDTKDKMANLQKLEPYLDIITYGKKNSMGEHIIYLDPFKAPQKHEFEDHELYERILDQLLTFTESFLEQNVKTDRFILVYRCLDVPNTHMMTLRWMGKFYDHLQDKYLKKLEKMIIYKPEFKLKLLIKMITPFMRGEFTQKLRIVNDPKSLAREQNLPEMVKKIKKK